MLRKYYIYIYIYVLILYIYRQDPTHRKTPPPTMQRDLLFTVGCKVGVCCYHPLWLDGTQPDRSLPLNPGTGWAGAQNVTHLSQNGPRGSPLPATRVSCPFHMNVIMRQDPTHRKTPPPTMQRDLLFTVGCKVGVCCYHPLWLDGTQPDRSLPVANSAK